MEHQICSKEWETYERDFFGFCKVEFLVSDQWIDSFWKKTRKIFGETHWREPLKKGAICVEKKTVKKQGHVGFDWLKGVNQLPLSVFGVLCDGDRQSSVGSSQKRTILPKGLSHPAKFWNWTETEGQKVLEEYSFKIVFLNCWNPRPLNLWVPERLNVCQYWNEVGKLIYCTIRCCFRWCFIIEKFIGSLNPWTPETLNVFGLAGFQIYLILLLEWNWANFTFFQ